MEKYIPCETNIKNVNRMGISTVQNLCVF